MGARKDTITLLPERGRESCGASRALTTQQGVSNTKGEEKLANIWLRASGCIVYVVPLDMYVCVCNNAIACVAYDGDL